MTTAVRPDFAYTPRYLDDLDSLPGLRIAVIDEGPSDAKHTFLCPHGQPTWGYLYRKRIPPSADQTSPSRTHARDAYAATKNLKYYYRVYENPAIYALDLNSQNPTGTSFLIDNRPSSSPTVTVPAQFS